MLARTVAEAIVLLVVFQIFLSLDFNIVVINHNAIVPTYKPYASSHFGERGAAAARGRSASGRSSDGFIMSRKARFAEPEPDYQPTLGMGAMSEQTEELGKAASSNLKSMLGGDKGIKLKEFAAMGLAAWLFGARTKRKVGTRARECAARGRGRLERRRW